ncbi:MAG: nucleotidyltransferase domain-containing protein [Polyangiales bacterium]
MERMSELGLDDARRAAIGQCVADEGARREHLVVALAGSWGYGFPSPQSYVDLKSVHVAPTAALLGFTPPEPAVEHIAVRHGVSVDYSSNEVSQVLAGVLAGNGNYLERLLAPRVVAATPDLETLRPLVQDCLSRRVIRHYHGFATGQRRLFEREPTVKKLLYVARTALTGAHLLREGAYEGDLAALLRRGGHDELLALLEARRRGAPDVDEALRGRWAGPLDAMLDGLQRAHDESPLPDAPRGQDALLDWLLALRRSRFGGRPSGIDRSG